MTTKESFFSEVVAPMDRALALAQQAVGRTEPNPRVGCVITSADGTRVLGVGHTQEAGGPHAEVMALRDVQATGLSAAGATAYVTLEPCSHHGRTPPCCDALVKAGIARVVASMEDPNPQVAGEGFARLRAAGIDVVTGPGQQESYELNIGFFSRMTRGLPWVRMKIAASLDGRTALEDGTSQWITSDPARADGHTWRARAGAILTGIGTVLDDNPRLDVRLSPVSRQPPLVVVDSRLQLPLDAAVFAANRQVLVYAAAANEERLAALQANGVTVITVSNAAGKVDLAAMLRDLALRGVNELHVEAGHKLNGSLVREGLVDELLVYMAPKLIGKGLSMADFGSLSTLDEAVGLKFVSTQSIGRDLRIIARTTGRDSQRTG